MNTDSIQIPVSLDSANRRKDKSVRLSFTSTFEMDTPDFAAIDEHIGEVGWVMFRANKSYEDSEAPKEDAPDTGKKASQRLRSVIYRCWELNTDQSEDSEVYYRRIMEGLISQLKERLP